MDDTYIQYAGHTYKIPAGAIEQYNSANEFTGYELAGGEVITAAEMVAMA